MTISTQGPYFRLDGPLPLPRRHTLLDIAQYRDLGDENHWLNGAWVQGYPQDPVFTFDPCSTGSEKQKQTGGAVSLPIFGAYQAYLTEQCISATVGPDANAWFTARAAAAFRVAEIAAAERVLVNGDGLPTWVTGPGVPHLTDSNLIQLDGGAAQNYVEGLALLEQAIGETGRGGVIHATPATVTFWASKGNLIGEDSNKILRAIATGTPIVVGDGYIGAYPDGASQPTSTQDWAFATGPIGYLTNPGIALPPRLIPDRYEEALNRQENIVTYRAERDYVLFYDSNTNGDTDYAPLQAGVLIDRTIDTP